MSVDRSWMDRRIATDENEVSSEFCSKVEAFLVFAFDHPQCVNEDKIKCPCKKCENLQWKERGDVKHDLHAYGFKQDYISWIYHGENDQLLKDVEVPLYDGHEKHTTLSAVTELLHFKTEHNFSEKAFNDLLPLIKEFLPADNNLPGSYNDMKQLAKKLNLRYENIDACAAGGAPDLSEETYQRLFGAIKQRVRAKQEHSTVIEAVQDLIGPGGSRFHEFFCLVQHEMHQEICRTFAEFSRNDIGSHPSQA